MNNFKNRILKNWSFMRIVRLALGCVALYEAWKTNDIILSLVGFFLLYQSVFNVGCCSSAGCHVDARPKKSESSNVALNEVTFSEVIKK